MNPDILRQEIYKLLAHLLDDEIADALTDEIMELIEGK